jgi:hypothetical protein
MLPKHVEYTNYDQIRIKISIPVHKPTITEIRQWPNTSKRVINAGFVTGQCIKKIIYVIYTDINEKLRLYYFVHPKLSYTVGQNYHFTTKCLTWPYNTLFPLSVLKGRTVFISCHLVRYHVHCWAQYVKYFRIPELGFSHTAPRHTIHE